MSALYTVNERFQPLLHWYLRPAILVVVAKGGSGSRGLPYVLYTVKQCIWLLSTKASSSTYFFPRNPKIVRKKNYQTPPYIPWRTTLKLYFIKNCSSSEYLNITDQAVPKACPAFIPLGCSASLLPRDVFSAQREAQTASRPDLVSSDLFGLDPGIDSDQGPSASRMDSISFQYLILFTIILDVLYIFQTIWIVGQMRLVFWGNLVCFYFNFEWAI